MRYRTLAGHRRELILCKLSSRSYPVIDAIIAPFSLTLRLFEKISCTCVANQPCTCVALFLDAILLSSTLRPVDAPLFHSCLQPWPSRTPRGCLRPWPSRTPRGCLPGVVSLPSNPHPTPPTLPIKLNPLSRLPPLPHQT